MGLGLAQIRNTHVFRRGCRCRRVSYSPLEDMQDLVLVVSSFQVGFMLSRVYGNELLRWVGGVIKRQTCLVV